MDIVEKINRISESKEPKKNEEYYTDVVNAKDFIKKLKSKLRELDCKSRFFSARFVKLDEEFDTGVVIIKFANALRTDDHNHIMKEAPTKLVIAVEGFDGKGNPEGHIRSKLVFFERMKTFKEGRGVFTTEQEKSKVTKEGTVCEVAKHIVQYFKDNIDTFTDSSAKFQNRKEEKVKMNEDGAAAAVTGTVSTSTNGGTQSDSPAPTSDGIDQSTMSGIARFKRPIGGENEKKKKRKDMKNMFKRTLKGNK